MKVSQSMDSFHDLQKSTQFEDKTIYDFFIRLLDALFGKHDQIVINSDCESEKNQQLIKDQWKMIEFYFKVPKRVKSTQKCVRQTLKHIVDFINNKYQFKQPLQFNLKRETIRNGDETFAKTYTIFNLV